MILDFINVDNVWNLHVYPLALQVRFMWKKQMDLFVMWIKHNVWVAVDVFDHVLMNPQGQWSRRMTHLVEIENPENVICVLMRHITGILPVGG